MGQDRYNRDFNNQPYRTDPFRGGGLWQTIDSNADESRYQDTQEIRRRPISIEKALREHCSIPGKHFFVAAIDDDGRINCFTSASCKLPQVTIETFFNKDAFIRSMSTSGSVSTPMLEEDLSFPSDPFQYPPNELGKRWNTPHRYNMSTEAFDDDGNPKMRKRMRSTVLRNDDSLEDDGPMPIVSTKRAIRVDDEAEIRAFYEQRFKNCQQTACKLIAKAWIKLVEPKKQSTHPYTGKDEKAPDWWPRPWGETKEEKVRHKEPDHLYKRERVHLLNHILQMIVEPNSRQHKDIRKLNLNVAKLEECTYDALSSFFADKENPSQAKKKPYLKEIFKVARQEQRYKAGEIDGGTKIHVMADDRIPDNWTSDNEAVGSLKEDDDQELTSVSSSISPQKGNSPSTMMAPQHAPDHSPATHMAGAQYLTDMPVRGGQYPQPILGADMATEQAHYVEGATIPGQAAIHAANAMPMHDMFQQAHDASRRSSMFNSATEYASPATPNMYSAPWQSGTAAPSNPPMYSFPPQQAPAPSFVPQHGVPMPHGQQYMGSSFDGLARGPHDAGHGTMFRSGSLGHNPSPHGPSYPGYPASGIKLETTQTPLV